jgi:hypothetical protein
VGVREWSSSAAELGDLAEGLPDGQEKQSSGAFKTEMDAWVERRNGRFLGERKRSGILPP